MFERITTNPEILGGKPCVRGTRISVELILEMFATGASIESVVELYPFLEKEDVVQALLFAANAMRSPLRYLEEAFA